MSTINPLDIKFHPSVVHGIYGINYYIHTENGDQQRIQFEAAIAYCGQYMDEYAIYHVSKREFIVNKNESDAYLYDFSTTELCVLHLDEKSLEYEKDIYLKKVEKEQKLKNGSLWEKIINIF